MDVTYMRLSDSKHSTEFELIRIHITLQIFRLCNIYYYVIYLTVKICDGQKSSTFF